MKLSANPAPAYGRIDANPASKNNGNAIAATVSRRRSRIATVCDCPSVSSSAELASNRD
jgi:hypothetical protein